MLSATVRALAGIDSVEQVANFEESARSGVAGGLQLPQSASWRMYSHCAAVTRLYSSWSCFVEEALEEWVALIPQIFTNYADLPETLKTRHIDATGAMLRDRKHRKYSNVTPLMIVKGLHDGLTGNPYELNAAAFAHTDKRNFHLSVVNDVLSGAGIPNASSWLSGHRLVAEAATEIVSADLNKALEAFLNYRNDAAHGDPAELLGHNGIIDYCNFCRAIIRATDELIANTQRQRLCALGQMQRIGTVTEHFRNADAVIATLERGVIKVGGSITLCATNLCCRVVVSSLQLNGKNVHALAAAPGTEVGLQWDGPKRRGLEIFT